jgi:hypothetical protein
MMDEALKRRLEELRQRLLECDDDSDEVKASADELRMALQIGESDLDEEQRKYFSEIANDAADEAEDILKRVSPEPWTWAT